MWKSVLIGALTALTVVATVVSIGCTAFFTPGICAARSKPMPPTVQSAEREKLYMREGAPEPYRHKTNPLEPSIANIVEGARLYDLRCAICHGMMGIGDGEGGAKLDTPPADLGRSLGQPNFKDDFFYWSISEGGAQFATDMPPFKNDLTDREIWRILAFMRAAFAEQKNPVATDATAPP